MLCELIIELGYTLSLFSPVIAGFAPLEFSRVKIWKFQGSGLEHLTVQLEHFYLTIVSRTRKRNWIPACHLGKHLSHILITQNHFLLILVNDFVRGWLSRTHPFPLDKKAFKVTCPITKLTKLTWALVSLNQYSTSPYRTLLLTKFPNQVTKKPLLLCLRCRHYINAEIWM